MGCKHSSGVVEQGKNGDGIGEEGGSTLEIMFNRIDKERKGYISKENLEVMMRDDKTFFQGRDVDRILDKYGSDGGNKMTFENFKVWWGSTYTTYQDDTTLAKIVDEIDIAAAATAANNNNPPTDAPLNNTNVAVSRS